MYQNPFRLIIALVITIIYAYCASSCVSSNTNNSLPKQTKYHKKSIQYSHCSMY